MLQTTHSRGLACFLWFDYFWLFKSNLFKYTKLLSFYFLGQIWFLIFIFLEIFLYPHFHSFTYLLLSAHRLCILFLDKYISCRYIFLEMETETCSYYETQPIGMLSVDHIIESCYTIYSWLESEKSSCSLNRCCCRADFDVLFDESLFRKLNRLDTFPKWSSQVISMYILFSW